MAGIVAQLREMIANLQAEMERDIDEKRQDFKYRLDRKKVVFEHDVETRHRQTRVDVLTFLRESKISFILTAPLLYCQIIPIALLDLFITVYQHACFRLYGIPRVRRGEHIVMDRQYLGYLNWIEKLNCIYCEYANGTISYAREVASRTEQYWCPIKHARKLKHPHDRYYDFLEYGDAEGFHNRLEAQRDGCRACEKPGSCAGKKE